MRGGCEVNWPPLGGNPPLGGLYPLLTIRIHHPHLRLQTKSLHSSNPSLNLQFYRLPYFRACWEILRTDFQIFTVLGMDLEMILVG